MKSKVLQHLRNQLPVLYLLLYDLYKTIKVKPKSLSEFLNEIERDQISLVFDFGANVGEYTNHFSRIADFVVSVDANKEMCNLIKKRNLKNVTVINAAVTECESSIVDFYVPIKNGIEHHARASCISPEAQDYKIVSVGGFRFTNWEKRLASVSNYAVKIDVEGLDLFCLKAVLKNWKMKPKIILIEISEMNDSELADLLSLTDRYSYGIRKIDHNAILTLKC